MPEWTICMLFFWNFAIISLHLRDSMLSSTSLLLSVNCHKSILVSSWLLTSFWSDSFQVSSSLTLIVVHLEVVTYFTLFRYIVWLVVIVMEILILLFFHRCCFINTYHIIFQEIDTHDMYKNYVNMVCTRTRLQKNIVTLTRRKSLIHPTWISLRVPFLWKLWLRVFHSFSLTQDTGSCSDHIFDSWSIVFLTYPFLDLVSSLSQTSSYSQISWNLLCRLDHHLSFGISLLR